MERRIYVGEPVFSIFPDFHLFCLTAHGLECKNLGEEKEKEIEEELRKANSKARRWITSDVISENESVAVWREAYKKFKTKKGARSSIEALLKRVSQDKPVSSITPLVDVYNAISLTFAVPVGGEDLDKIQGSMGLCLTKGGDAFLPIGSEDNEPTLEGEICYLDDAGAVCRCMNWRDGQRTELSDGTKDAIFLIECTQKDLEGRSREAMEELGKRIENYFGAGISGFVLDSAHPSHTLEAGSEGGEERIKPEFKGRCPLRF
ncbi:MAG: hypothetical protein J6O91_00060 [Aeriscardovia sp.]|nr:hypothetical protein [Aeriscardovia sp.]